jgi:DNA-binding MarR family transcriptional regulator
MKDLLMIKNIVSLTSRLQNLCEGFDDSKKTALLSAKLKILLEVSQHKKLSPGILKNRVGLAKSNLALACNMLTKQGLIVKSKDEFDTRSIFYSITSKGDEVLNQILTKMKENFEGELAYKNNLKQIDETVANLLSCVS